MSLKMIVCSGVPGAGKTTLSKSLYEDLKETHKCKYMPWVPSMADKNIFERAWVFIILLYLLIKDYQTTWMFLHFGKKIKPFGIEAFRTTIAAIKSFHFESNLAKKYDDYDYLILDEGILLRLWSIVITGNISSKKELRSLVQFVSNHYRLINIHISVSHETSANRIKERGTFYGNLEHLTRKDIIKTLSLKKYNDDILQGVIASEEGIQTIEIDGKECMETCVSRIKKELGITLNKGEKWNWRGCAHEQE